MKVSVCIPCYRAAKNIPIVVEGLKKIISARGDEYQIILANDGSPDNTFEVISELCREDKGIIGIDLIKNYGQSSAKLAALKYATGDVVLFMDDDGQHPVEHIYDLIDKLQDGYDVVYGYFSNKTHSTFKRITSSIHKWLAAVMGNKAKGVHTSPFHVWNKTVAESMKRYHSPFISIGGYITHVTSKFGEVEVPHKERLSGTSGYTFKKLIKIWKDIFFSFSMMPLQIATTVGIVVSAGGFLGIIYLIILKVVHSTVLAGYVSTNIFILFFGGLILFSVGIVGEYIGRIYMTVSNMPQYSIRSIINDEKSA